MSPYLPASSATKPSSWAQRSLGHYWWSVCQSWLLPAAEPAQSGTPLRCTKQRRAMRKGSHTHTHTQLWTWHMGLNFCLHLHCVVAEFVCSCQGTQQSDLWRMRCKRWKNRSLRTGRWTLWRWDCHQTQSGCDASLWHYNGWVSDCLIKMTSYRLTIEVTITVTSRVSLYLHCDLLMWLIMNDSWSDSPSNGKVSFSLNIELK